MQEGPHAGAEHVQAQSNKYWVADAVVQVGASRWVVCSLQTLVVQGTCGMLISAKFDAAEYIMTWLLIRVLIDFFFFHRV